MSEKYPGGFITKNAPQPTGGESGTAPGIWTLEQALQYIKAGTWPIQPVPKYIEDVFSTYLYTGNGSTQTITNGIDLSTKGGLVWIKNRGAAQSHGLSDTARGAGNWMSSDLTVANIANNNGGVSAFTSTGFSVNTSDAQVNGSSNTYASWTFRKQAKFFDVVTYTGNGASNRTIAHNLGSTPGCVIIKNTTSASDWPVYHRSLGFSTGGAPYNGLILNGTSATGTYDPPISAASSTTITVTTSGSNTNQNGQTFVAYLFAHDAGGFGVNGTDNVISCGSYTTDGSGNATVTLGYEPQWVLVKPSSGTGNWWILDNMRAFTVNSSANAYLLPNSSAAEGTNTYPIPTATGFITTNTASTTYIYIAIRRGPMKTPTSSTTVFSPVTYTGNGSSQTITSPNFAPDMLIGRIRASSTAAVVDKMRGSLNYLYTSNTDAEVGSNSTSDVTAFTNTGFSVGADNRGNWNTSSGSEIVWSFGRAPGFFDVVCYTGTGANRTVSHNLGVAPELMIVKRRSTADGEWSVYSSTIGNANRLRLNATDASTSNTTSWNSTTPTSSVFTVGTNTNTNQSGQTFVAYLFASVTGVSKVGSYTGTGTTLQVNCGFTNGSRFVLIKRTDSTGDWYVWDSARGIVAGDDPYLLLNSTAAEVTNTDYVDTYSAGFELSSTAPAAINANGGTYIFLAIA